MKKFILTGIAFFIFGVLATIGVFFAINYFSFSPSFEEIKNGVGDSLNNPLGSAKNKIDAGLTNESFSIGEEGLPLKNLSLGNAQKKTLEAVGINTETFVITKTMLECAQAEVGSERVAAFAAGEAPSVIEIGKLLPCLR